MEQFSLEKVKEEIIKKIETAIGNPISDERLEEIERELARFNSIFIEKGFRDEEQDKAEKQLEEEILKSSALAENIVEFEIMLNYLSERFGTQHDWIDNYLAHENAHANVAEATGHESLGYATVFIKDNSGELVSIQPVHITKPQPEWGPKEVFSKNIEVLEAPEKYGDKLSDGDRADIELSRQKLRKIEERENKDKEKLEEVRKELGI